MSKVAEKPKKDVEQPKKPARRNITISHKRAALPEKTVDEIRPAGGCAHRWVIESPNGETSHGVCRVCGAERDFPTAAEDGLWERNVPQSRWTGRTEYSKSDGGSGY